MDNRLIFLYCSITELWGHVRRAGAGDGLSRYKRGRSHVGKSAWQSEDVMWTELSVGKYVSHVPGKAAIVHTAPVP